MVLIWLPGQAGAAPIAYDIQMGTQGGFGYSYIHSADNQMGTTGFYASGDLLFQLSEIVYGDLIGNALTISASALTAEGLPAGPTGTYTLQFTGASLDNSSGFAGGTIEYTILDPGLAVWDTGTFHFEAKDMTGPTNGFSSADIYIWGQNWDRNTMTRQEFVNGGGTPLGIDLGGVWVPEPSTILLIGSGILGIAVLKRKREWLSPKHDAMKPFPEEREGIGKISVR